jgi:hypothetical protein
MAVANTQAYYDTAMIKAVKSFILQAPCISVMKDLTFSLMVG